MPEIEIKKAFLYAKKAPDKKQEEGFASFLKKEYGEDIKIEFVESDKYKNGFRLVYGAKTYDWNNEGRLSQFKEKLSSISLNEGNLIPLISETVHNWTPKAMANEIGYVLTVGDGIATVSGLEHVTYGEILIFDDGIRGMALDLRENEVGCILFGEEEKLSEGSLVRRTGKTAGIPVGEGFLGRVVNALGDPIDGEGPIKAAGYRAIENPAPRIIERQRVNRPLQTGILSIDSMFPIGRGQRELIIGDRQTGKTAIATDTILNQKGQDVICIYVAIGQKTSQVAHTVNVFREKGAMEYTIVLSASASESSPMQYIAPYAGCALAEFFMHEGKDVLIVYDDLSKHAVAYRTISLLLERSPGREAYPGDVFYLHSRLLERSAHLSDALGGGSMTALPIVETLEGDVTAYIPTNIISITDGQIFLESELFFSGYRPAINAGLSVSRVGSDAQTKAMKKATKTLRLDLAQYREMEAFTQFASEMDDATKRQIAYGEGLMEMLKQKQNSPKLVHVEVITLITAMECQFDGVKSKKVNDYLAGAIAHIEKEYPGVCEAIDKTGLLDDSDKENIIETIKKYHKEYTSGDN